MSPVDVRSPMAFAIATPTKLACDGAPPVRGALGFFSGGDEFEPGCFEKDPGVPLYFFIFSGSFS